MGTEYWVAGAVIIATILLIIVFTVCLSCGAIRRWYQRRQTASVDRHVPLP